jgi:hypothetical protein
LPDQNIATTDILRPHHYCFVFHCSLVGGGVGVGVGVGVGGVGVNRNNFEVQSTVIRKLVATQLVQVMYYI